MDELLSESLKNLIKESVQSELANQQTVVADKRRWLSVKEAYEYIGISKSTFFKWRRDGYFTVKPSVVGDTLRYDRDKVDDFMESHE